MRFAPLLLICALWSCAPFPQIEGTNVGDSPAPRLVPLATILAQSTGAAAPDTFDLTTRIARLTARAARLRGPVVDSATRARMRAAL